MALEYNILCSIIHIDYVVTLYTYTRPAISYAHYVINKLLCKARLTVVI